MSMKERGLGELRRLVGLPTYKLMDGAGGMLRHNSGSIISSLQNYGDSDDEEMDTKNVIEPFKTQSSESVPEQKQSPSPGPDRQDTGITFSAEATSTQRSEVESDPGSRLAEQDADANSGQDGEDEKTAPEVSPAELISDDEGDPSHPHSHSHNKSPPKSDLKEAVADAIGETLNADSPSSQGSTKPGRQAARLVSYGPDEDHDEDETSSEEEEAEESESNSPEGPSTDNSALSRSVRNLSSDEIQIPPEPPGKCSAELQKKIEDSFEKMRREGLDLNRIIQSKKHFRNPSIYEKLIAFCHIDEKGTNFPPELYDPHIWGKESFHDELDKAQRKDMERREKEKKEKTKIEFLTGTKKSGSDNSSSGAPDEKRRKTKWDAQPSSMNIQVSKLPSAQQNPGVVNLTATATGTKATIIPAVGSLSKKSSSGK
ncbi:sap30-binding protein [Plakobranchus ocellatus]|uniref:Sap30-binding protein n=1 Tax=Plakobranchus ocellatus TaxID=259542 RepID=A0AAV4BS96_9GAST|nr:sap30-binding protein [Plakobranchus ocellatus]